MRFYAFTGETASEIGVRRSPVSALQSLQQSPQENTASHYPRTIRLDTSNWHCSVNEYISKFVDILLLVSSLSIHF